MNHPGTLEGALLDLPTLFAAIGADCSTDLAQRHRYAALLRRHAPDLVSTLVSDHFKLKVIKPMPDPKIVTAAQCSIFDNWVATGGKRPKRGEKGNRAARFKATFDLWTIDPDVEPISPSNTAFSATVHLLTGKELDAKVSELEIPGKTKRPFIEATDLDEGTDFVGFAAMLRAYASEIDEIGIRVGPVFSSSEGRHFHAHTFASVLEESLTSRSGLKLVVKSPTGSVTFTGFSPFDAKGNPLKGNCVLHSRMTRSTRLASTWRASILPGD